MKERKKQTTYLFKSELKNTFLNGRTICFIANEVGISKPFLSYVLNGKRKCSKIVAKNLLLNAPEEKPFEYYFKEE